MRVIKSSLKYIAVFLVFTAFLTGLLTAVALIPRSAIKENVEASARFLCEGELFGEVIEGIKGSKIDRYADSILLGIAYQYDDKEPLQSVMWSSYHYEKYQNVNENLFEAVTRDLDANQEYLRYWHGSNVVVRPLLMFFSIEQIYVLNAVLLSVLIVGLFFLLVKEKAWGPVTGLGLGLVMTNSWFVPLSLEYTWNYIIMFLMAILCWKLSGAGVQKYLGRCFLVAGMITNYMDFLTTEILTLLVPLLLLMWRDYQNKVCEAIKWTVAWGTGYIGMWLMKWLLASMILKENVLPYVTGHMIERTSGDVGLGWITLVIETIRRNVSCLLPFEYGTAGAVMGILILVIVLYVGYVYQKKQLMKDKILLYGMIGLVPFIRYIVLLNHSYLHSFFTYRALLATILAIVMILAEVVEWRWLIHADERKTKS